MKTKLILATMATILTSGAGAQTQPAPAKKVLVAYYSHSGNTREVARQIAGASGGELFEIIPVTPYPSDYQTVVDQAKKEIAARGASCAEKPGRRHVAVRCDFHRFALLVGYRGSSRSDVPRLV